VSKVVTRNTVMCDKLPAQTQFVSASRPVEFKGAKACFKLGNLKPGQVVKTVVKLLIDRNTKATKVVNPATAVADNAKQVKAKDTVRIPPEATPRRPAPVTG
jgi:hypothetical protein